jgi:hypothetical protein
MKIHPNHEIDQMLKDGTVKVISYKALPRRYLDIKKDTPSGAISTGSGGNTNSGNAAAEATSAAAPMPEFKPVETPGVQAEVIQQETLPDIPAALLVTVPDAPAETELKDDLQDIPPEAELLDAAPIIPSEAEPQDEAPVIPSEAEQQDEALVVTPEAEPQDEMLVVPPEVKSQDAASDTASEAAQLTALNIPSSAEKQDAVPGVIVNVIRPESAPGGLVAEIYMEGDPAGLVFGESPGYVTYNSEFGIAQSKDYELSEEDPSYPPYVNFTCFNRIGLTIKNLTNLLDSDEEFELNIIDCNSKDNSWDYIQSLTDRRIKSRIRFGKNCGPIFAVNFGLSRRKPNQYFIVIDSDTFIKTKNWIARFMEVFNTFPEVGLLGLMRDNPYPRFLPPIIPRVNGSISYLELKNADINTEMDFIPGQLQCLRPSLIREIGYWSEENGFGDAELSPRIVHYTNFKVGFVTTIEIDMTQRITCEECMGKNICTLSRSISDCFSMSRLYNKNESFVAKNTWKFKQTFEELKEGQRTAFCASIHDPESVRTHKYNADWAYDNFNHYIINAN